MPYNLPQAAAAVGRDRSTILRAIKAGKLSATRDAASNGWLIEPAELHRLYAVQPDAQQRNADGTAVLEAKFEAEQAKVGLLERSVDDLRRRLDASEAERRAAQAQVTALLTDQRAAPPAPTTPRRRWWSWRR
jgi:hypothetical protein